LKIVESTNDKKPGIFSQPTKKLKAQFAVKNVKYLHFSLFNCPLETKSWRLPSPHISTSENLHVKAKGVLFEASSKIFAFQLVLPKTLLFFSLCGWCLCGCRNFSKQSQPLVAVGWLVQLCFV
jgi:hypothetical protein